MKKIYAFLALVTIALSLSISSHARCVKRKKSTNSISGYEIRKMTDMHVNHEMQHGFIIAEDESLFSHLVASGHHSHQLSFYGKLSIKDPAEKEFYLGRREQNATDKKSYFFFQAQKLNLPLTFNGQVLVGHIVESPTGDYTPQNVIVRDAQIRVEKVLINVINPFFID